MLRVLKLLKNGSGILKRNRLPPGQRLVKNWPVLDLGTKPNLDLDKWALTIDGDIKKPVKWTWSQFLSQPHEEMISDIHCVTGWSRYDNRWVGIKASHIIKTVKPLSTVKHCIFHSYDGYKSNISIKQFTESNVMLAFMWNGDLLSAGHGGPVRALLPSQYFWKSAKWIRKVEFSHADQLGYWELRGYHNNGNPWKEERYSN